MGMHIRVGPFRFFLTTAFLHEHVDNRSLSHAAARIEQALHVSQKVAYRIANTRRAVLRERMEVTKP